MAEKTPPTETIAAAEARRHWSALVERVNRGEARVIVERSGIPVAAIVSPNDMKLFTFLLEKRERNFEVLDRIGDALLAFRLRRSSERPRRPRQRPARNSGVSARRTREPKSGAQGVMTRAVVDTNVLVSGFPTVRDPRSTPGEVIRAWRTGRFEMAVSEHILSELARAFQRPYFRRLVTQDDAARADTLLRRQAVVVPITISVHGVATHPEDDLILATALSAHADALVTGDAALLRLGAYGGVPIMSPRTLLEWLAARG